MTDNTQSKGGGSEPEVRIADPVGELTTVFNKTIVAFREEAHKADEALATNIGELKDTLKTAIKRQENVTYLVIIVMAIGFFVLLFSLATVLITSWQATQSIHDAVQSQQNNASTQQQAAPVDSRATSNSQGNPKSTAQNTSTSINDCDTIICN